ncbi:MAG: hypothetical protein RTV41_12835 [Candidatus Thorarchaeota archaeon]
MLPIDIAMDLFAWMEFTRNIVILIPMTLALVYITKRSSEDEMWIGQRFAHAATLIFAFYLVASILTPFLIMSLLYPAFSLEIGVDILSYSSGGIALTIFIVLVLEIAQYWGLFHKK